MDLTGKIAQCNGRLRAANVGVSIEQRGDRLLLRATLPPRPGSSKTNNYQQRIAVGLPANLDGLRRAEKEARKIGALLATKEFTWEPYLRQFSATSGYCSEWVERFKAQFFANGGTETTWNGDYWKIFKKLPQQMVMDAEILRHVIEGTRPNSKTRRRACMAIASLATFAEIELDVSQLRGNYQPGAIDPRNIPSDEQIAQSFYQLENSSWRWVYGMMACYGLRNHEVFRCSLEDFPIVRIHEQTKTGSREVWPCYPEWADAFDLASIKHPPIDLARSNERVGHSVTRYLSPLLDFQPYDLRHAWAIRTAIFGWPVELAARQMGHSVEMHTRTYHRWLNREHQQRVFDLLVNRSDRPQAPSVFGSAGDANGRFSAMREG